MDRDLKTYARAICRHRNGNNWSDSPDRKQMIEEATALLKTHMDRITPWHQFRLHIAQFLAGATSEASSGARRKRSCDTQSCDTQRAHSAACKKQRADVPVCCVCLETVALLTLAPCGHRCVCAHCCSSLRQCPMCRARIESTITTVFG